MVFIDKIKYVSFFNDTGEEIPPFACMIITGCTVESDELVLSIRKCDDADENLQEPASILFNSILPVADAEFGVGTRDMPCQALVNQPSAAFSDGKKLGPKENSWALDEVGSCFRVVTKDETDPHIESAFGVYLVEPYHGKTDFHVGRTTSNVSAGSSTTAGSGTVMLKKISQAGEITDDRSVNVKNPGSAVGIGSLVYVWRSRNEYILVEVCP